MVTSQELKIVLVTSQELKIVCGQSNKKRGKQLFFVRLLLIRSEKTASLSWESKKGLITKKNHSPQTYQMVRP